MKKKIFLVIPLAAMLFTSCDAVKRFFTTDLSDEDYIVGQLYLDEYVKEQPVKMKKPSESESTGSVDKLGIPLNDKDNRKLYTAIEKWFGTPYQYGGCSTSGVDCSCFVGNIFKSVYGITMARTANDMTKDVKLISRSQLREGDLVFFTNSNGKVSHVGIYLKEDLFAHSSTSNGVSISTLENSYWKKHFYKGGRHKDVTTKY